MSFLRNTGWSTTGSIVTVASRLAFSVIVARSLGPENFGRFIFVLWLVEITFIICSIGLEGVATRFYPQYKNEQESRASGFSHWFLYRGLLVIFSTSIFSVVAVFAFGSINDPKSLVAIYLLALFSSSYLLLMARAQGMFQFRYLALTALIFSATSVFGLTLFVENSSIEGAIVILVVSNFLAIIMLTYKSNPVAASSKKPLSESMKIKIIEYAKNTWLTSIGSSLIWSKGELPLVKSFSGESAVGLYSVGITISGVVNGLLSLLTGALWPKMAALWDRNELKDMSSLYVTVTHLVILLSGLAVGFLICFSDLIILALFGSEFLSASGLVQILALGTIGLTAGSAHLILQASSNGRFSRNLTILAAPVLFGGALLLLPYFGSEGAAMARTGTQVGMAIITFAYVSNVLPPEARTTRCFLFFGITLSICAGMVFLRKVYSSFEFPDLMMLYLLYVVVINLIYMTISESSVLRELKKLSQVSSR
mgnify:CR=1 FL=1